MERIERPWIRKPDQKWGPTNPEPLGLYADENISASLDTMRDEALELGLEKGVAFLVVYPFFADEPRVVFRVVKTLEREPNPNNENDIGTNYFGIAMQKLAYMLTADEDSGGQKRPLRKGEVEYRGGLVVITEEGTRIYSGYSGGTEDQDVQIAQKGLEKLIELAEEE